MAEDPVAVVRGAYDGFGRGDIPGVLAVIDPQAQWVESTAEGLPARGTHIGPAAVAANVFAAIPGAWEEFAIVPEDFFSDGQRWWYEAA